MLHLLFDNKEPVEELTNKWAQFKKEHLHKNDLRRAFESIQDHLHRDDKVFIYKWWGDSHWSQSFGCEEKGLNSIKYLMKW